MGFAVWVCGGGLVMVWFGLVRGSSFHSLTDMTHTVDSELMHPSNTHHGLFAFLKLA